MGAAVDSMRWTSRCVRASGSRGRSAALIRTRIVTPSLDAEMSAGPSQPGFKSVTVQPSCCKWPATAVLAAVDSSAGFNILALSPGAIYRYFPSLFSFAHSWQCGFPPVPWMRLWFGISLPGPQRVLSWYFSGRSSLECHGATLGIAMLPPCDGHNVWRLYISMPVRARIGIRARDAANCVSGTKSLTLAETLSLRRRPSRAAVAAAAAARSGPLGRPDRQITASRGE